MSVIKYFAYGSNLSRNQMEERTNTVPPAVVAWLEGYRLVFNKKGSDCTGKANIEPAPGETVWGVVYDCTEEALKKIDHYERVEDGHYRRDTVTVKTKGEMIDAICYIAEVEHINNELKPTDNYLQKILEGANDHDFPDEVVQAIKQAAGRC